MKKLVALVVAVAGLGVVFAWPSHAASYTIAGPAPVFADGANRFKLSNCNPALDGAPTDGVDSQIVNIGGRGGSTLNITWSGTSTGIPGQLAAMFYSGNCTYLNPHSIVSPKPGPWSVSVPGGAQWMVVVSSLYTQVTFSF